MSNRLLYVASFVLILSCVAKADDIDIFCYNKSFLPVVEWQKKDIGLRFKKANVVFCHGMTIHGLWIAVPDEEYGHMIWVQELVDRILKKDSSKPLILLICNEDQHKVFGKNVYYFYDCIYIHFA